jgi:hypothetical protein
MRGVVRRMPKVTKKDVEGCTMHKKRLQGSVTLWPCHLSMKEGCLFRFVVMRSTELGCFRSCSWCLWKALDEEWCMGLVVP